MRRAILRISCSSRSVSTEPSDFFGLSYFRLGLPHAVMALSAVFLAVTFAATLLLVFGKVYERDKRWPSLNMLVPYVAMYLWWVPMFIQNEYYMYVVPFFHSLQYLPFVYKIERGRNRDVAPARAAPATIADRPGRAATHAVVGGQPQGAPHPAGSSPSCR